MKLTDKLHKEADFFKQRAKRFAHNGNYEEACNKQHQAQGILHIAKVLEGSESKIKSSRLDKEAIQAMVDARNDLTHALPYADELNPSHAIGMEKTIDKLEKKLNERGVDWNT